MKRFLALTSAILVLLLNSCSFDDETSTGPDDPDPNPGTVDYLTVNVDQTLRIDSLGLEVKFDTVYNDNRCPANAYCVWEGVVEIRIEIGTSDQDHQGLFLIRGGSSYEEEPLRYVTTVNGVYAFQLVEVSPYPGVIPNATYEDYNIAFRVTKVEGYALDGDLILSDLPTSNLLSSAINTDVVIDSIWTRDSTMFIAVQYSGGCRPHQFTLFMDPSVLMESEPPQADLYLQHFSDNDACRALVTQTLSFNLKPLIDIAPNGNSRLQLNVYRQENASWVLDDQLLFRPHGHNPNAILPLEIGNYWVYVDTVWRSGVPNVTRDSFAVVDYEVDTLGEWWVLNKYMYNLGKRLLIKGDSLYTHQRGFNFEYPEREYIPPVESPLTYDVIKSGDMLYSRIVSALDTALTVPAGTFDGVWKYDGLLYCYFEQIEYLEPGVGFIFMDRPCDDPHGDAPPRHVWLVSYSVDN